MKGGVQVSLVVVQYGDSGLLWRLLTSLEPHADRALISEAIVVNNALSLDEEQRAKLSAYRTLPLRIVDNLDGSYASGVNRGVQAATGDILVIANNDVEWPAGPVLAPLLECLLRDPGVGIVGPQLVYADGSWQRSYGSFPSLKEGAMSLAMLDALRHGLLMLAFRHNWSVSQRAKEVDYIDGAFMVVRRRCLEELGGFNEDYMFYGEDADFCWRAWKRGWKVVFVPTSRVVHVRGASSTAYSRVDYATRLVRAQQKFVQDHFGSTQAQWYRRLVRVALFERFVLYGLVAKLTGSAGFANRAEQARARFRAFGVGDL